MAVISHYMGEFRKGDHVRFAIDNSHAPSAAWNAGYYEVIDNVTMITVQSILPLTRVTDSDADLYWVDLELADVFDTDDKRFYTWVEGRTYTIVIHEASDGTGDTEVCHFRVVPNDNRAFLGVVEKGKNLHFIHREEDRSQLWFDVVDAKTGSNVLGNQDMTGPMTQPGGQRFFSGEVETEGTDDLAVGRTYWIRVKDKRAEDPNLDWLYSFTVMPRIEYDLARLLAYAGENVVMDSFSYDQAGNITGLRVRLFSNSDDADNATQGVTDPEPGEIAACTITQEHNIPRNIRTFHKSVLNFLSSTFPKEQ